NFNLIHLFTLFFLSLQAAATLSPHHFPAKATGGNRLSTSRLPLRRPLSPFTLSPLSPLAPISSSLPFQAKEAAGQQLQQLAALRPATAVADEDSWQQLRPAAADEDVWQQLQIRPATPTPAANSSGQRLAKPSRRAAPATQATTTTFAPAKWNTLDSICSDQILKSWPVEDGS
ncbi:hypothetical protein AABB24_005709, partial [Solanum stoloniferum]